MSRTLLLVGTRKGLFMLESDADRKSWSMRGAYCEGWPVYHAVFDQDSGAIYAAAASEWHGSSIWRSADLGETWTQSSEDEDRALDLRRSPYRPGRVAKARVAGPCCGAAPRLFGDAHR